MAAAQTYQSEFTGQEMDARFTAVATLTAALEALTAVVAGKYVKPADGIPSSDMTAAVQASLAKAESAVQSLADYYTKTEVDQLLAAINGMDYVDVSTLPTASASTMGKIYLLGPDASGYYAYYYTSYDGTDYAWVGPLGTTEISLAGYATKAELSQLDQKVFGEEETVTITKTDTTTGKYINNSGEYSDSSSGLNIDSFEIGVGNTCHILVPRVPNGFKIYGWNDTSPKTGALDLTDCPTGAYQQNYEADLTATKKFLFICYYSAYGAPTVTTKVQSDPAFPPMADFEALENRVEDLENEIDGQTVQDAVDSAYIAESTYMSVSYGGATVASSSGAAVAFYPIVSGGKYIVSVPKACNSAGYIIGYTDRTGNDLGDAEVFEDTGTVGTGAAFSKTIDSAPNHAYLAVCYTAEDGAPTVEHEYMQKTVASEQELQALAATVGGMKKKINILCLGNSFTQDAFNYAPWIFKGIAPDVEINIVMAIIGGCTMAQHCANITGVAQTIDDTTYSPGVQYGCFQYMNGADAWSGQTTKTIAQVLAMMEWDIITFQQNGYDNYKDFATYYAPFLAPTFKALVGMVEKPFRLGWLLTHGSYVNTASAALEHWEGSAENTENVLDTTPIDVLFPYGTAIQNLRTTSINVGTGVGILQADDAHLQEGIATLCASYSTVLTLLKLAGKENAGIMGEGTRPDLAWITGHACPGTNYHTEDVVEGVTDANCYLAQAAAVAAQARPFEVTTII